MGAGPHLKGMISIKREMISVDRTYPYEKEETTLPILTTEELRALTEQMELERTMHRQYLAAAQDSQDQQLQEQFQNCAQQHLQNYSELLDHLC